MAFWLSGTTFTFGDVGGVGRMYLVILPSPSKSSLASKTPLRFLSSPKYARKAQSAFMYRFVFCSSVSYAASSSPYFFAHTIANTTFIESPGAIDENGPLETNIDLFEGVLNVTGFIGSFHLWELPKSK